MEPKLENHHIRLQLWNQEFLNNVDVIDNAMAVVVDGVFVVGLGNNVTKSQHHVTDVGQKHFTSGQPLGFLACASNKVLQKTKAIILNIFDNNFIEFYHKILTISDCD